MTIARRYSGRMSQASSSEVAEGDWILRRARVRPEDEPIDEKQDHLCVVLAVDDRIHVGRVDAVTFDADGKPVPAIGRRTWVNHITFLRDYKATDAPKPPAALVAPKPAPSSPVVDARAEAVRELAAAIRDATPHIQRIGAALSALAATPGATLKLFAEGT